MTLTSEPELDSVELNHRAKYLGETSFSSKVVIAGHTKTHTHRSDRSLYLHH